MALEEREVGGRRVAQGDDALIPTLLWSILREVQHSSPEKKAGSVIPVVIYSSFYTFALSGIFFENPA